jgi:hypothetical protein
MTNTTNYTNEAAGHQHPISDPSSGYTDYVNGHRHKLSTGCTVCNRVRKTVFRGRMLSSFNNGHAHFFNGDLLN